jgi:hypothetical protein
MKTKEKILLRVVGKKILGVVGKKYWMENTTLRQFYANGN